MQALKIECRVANAWSPPDLGVHLDGLIAWALVEQARKSGQVITDYDEILSDLPLSRHEFPNGEWVWQASQLVPVDMYGVERRMLTGRTPANEMFNLVAKGVVSSKGGKWDGSRGPEKNNQVFYTTERIGGLKGWCIGDADALADLLDEVRAVGTRTRIGMGALIPFEDDKFWRITPCDDAATLWSLRNLPDLQGVPDLSRYADIGTYRPPYWRGSASIYRPIITDYMTYREEPEMEIPS